jgi:hypothetical protein
MATIRLPADNNPEAGGGRDQPAYGRAPGSLLPASPPLLSHFAAINLFACFPHVFHVHHSMLPR